MLTYKAELMGIQVLTEESYTSKASFLDADPLPVYGTGASPLPSAAGGCGVVCIGRRMDGTSTRM